MSGAVAEQQEVEALREIVNVAMGQAADSLARLFNAFVKLPIPRVKKLVASEMLEAMREILGEHDQITAVRQGFTGPMHGEALVIFDAAGCHELADLMGYDDASINEDELLLDVANVLNGACLGGIARQLSYELSFSAPSILVHRGSLDDLMESTHPLPWSKALLVEVNFKIEDRLFRCNTFVFWPEAAMGRLEAAVEAFLEGIA
jgi:chemotaxis protein CheC